MIGIPKIGDTMGHLKSIPIDLQGSVASHHNGVTVTPLENHWWWVKFALVQGVLILPWRNMIYIHVT